MPFRQDTAFLAIGERTNANGSKAFREAMIADNYEDCVSIAKSQSRDGAHLLDVCIDYVGRDGVADMREIAGRLATAATLPLVLDSTEPAVIEAGLELIGGRSVVNSVNYEDGDGPDSRMAKLMPVIREHGAAVVALTIDERGQARTAPWKIEVAERLINDLTVNWGMREEDIILDCLTFPIATGQEETRRDGIETIEAIAELKRRHPSVQTTLGLSNVSFGLKPAARQVLNSVFLHECVQAGLDSAIVHPSKILPLARIPDEQREVALDLVYDRRRPDYDPLQRMLELFEGVDATSAKAERAAEFAVAAAGGAAQAADHRRRAERPRGRPRPGPGGGHGRPRDRQRRPARRHEDGRRAVRLRPDAAPVRAAVGRGHEGLGRATWNRTWRSSADGGRGRIVLATVRGDVHDIGKNLVDIILSNNGYEVVNIGIKQPVSAIIAAAEEHNADVIGMSGLLVKSTVVMRDNLAELNARGLAKRWPVLLGGAALTRAYVEQDLAALFEGEVRYARDAFEGLRLMEAAMAVKHGVPGAALPALRERRVAARPDPRAAAQTPAAEPTPAQAQIRSEAVAVDNPRARAAVLGDPGGQGPAARRVRGVPGRARHLHGPVGTQAVAEGGRPLLRGPRRDRGAAAAADVAGAGADRGDAAGRRRLRVLPLRQRGQRPDRAVGDGRGAGAVHVPAPAARRAALPVRLLPAEVVGGDRRDRLPARHHGPGRVRGDRRAVRQERLPRVPRAARRLGPAHRGPGRVLARAGPAGARHRRRRPGRARRVLLGQVPGRPVLDRLPGLPDLADRAKIARLLQPERIGVELSEEMQLHPEQSTDAIVVHHPAARYFSV